MLPAKLLSTLRMCLHQAGAQAGGQAMALFLTQLQCFPELLLWLLQNPAPLHSYTASPTGTASGLGSKCPAGGGAGG